MDSSFIGQNNESHESGHLFNLTDFGMDPLNDTNCLPSEAQVNMAKIPADALKRKQEPVRISSGERVKYERYRTSIPSAGLPSDEPLRSLEASSDQEDATLPANKTPTHASAEPESHSKTSETNGKRKQQDSEGSAERQDRIRLRNREQVVFIVMAFGCFSVFNKTYTCWFVLTIWVQSVCQDCVGGF